MSAGLIMELFMLARRFVDISHALISNAQKHKQGETMNRVFKTFGAVLLIAALVSVTLLAQSSVLASNKVSPDLGSVAQQNYPPTNSITVSGYGTSSGKPDVGLMLIQAKHWQMPMMSSQRLQRH
jgi:hypothetical protein